MKKKPCRSIYDSCLEERISSTNSIVECSPINNEADMNSSQNNDGNKEHIGGYKLNRTKRRFEQESGSFHEKKKRRSGNDNGHGRSTAIKQKDDVNDDNDRTDPSTQVIITPSPAIFHSTESRIENVKDIAIDLNLSEECALEINKKCQSTQSPHHYGTSAGSSTKSASLLPTHELPPGVHPIVCPYLKSYSSAIRRCCNSDTGKYASEPHHNLFPCACAFIYDDACGIINIESYLVSYLDEYMESLKQNEFNIGQVSNKFFPAHLRNVGSYEFHKIVNTPCSPSTLDLFPPSFIKGLDRKKLSKNDARLFLGFFGIENHESLSSKGHGETLTPHPSNQSTSLFARDRFRYYMDYIPRYNERYPKSLPIVTPNIRAVLVDWLIEVAAEYNLGSITLHTAVGLVDRCLASEQCQIVKSSFLDKRNKIDNNCDETGEAHSDEWLQKFQKKTNKSLIVSRKTIQLLGCGCMMIASKIHEIHPPDTKDFRYISASQYTIREITAMEKDICTALAFHLHITTPHHFANIYLRASYVSGNALNRPVCSMSYYDGGSATKDSQAQSKGQLTINFLVDYLLEISMLHYEFVYIEPSKVAASAIYLARAILGIRDAEDPCDKHKQGYFSRTLKYYSGYDAKKLKTVVLELHDKHKKAPNEVLKTVYDKYKKEKFGSVALKPPVDRDLLISSFNGFQP